MSFYCIHGADVNDCMVCDPSEGDYDKAAAELDAIALRTRQRNAFKALQEQINRLASDLSIAELPSYFDDPKCDCGDEQNLHVITDGYEQWCKVHSYNIDHAAGSIKVSNDGWDDMSEDGYVSYLQCIDCNQVWGMPDETVWS